IYHHHDDDVEQVRHGFQPLELEDDELVGGDVEGRRPVEEVTVSAIRAEIPEIERELARDRLQMLDTRSDENTPELQSLKCTSYAVFCLITPTTIMGQYTV